MAEKFISHIKVDKKIVSLLSKSTYQKSFSSAIRELVSNAYDADALLVKINHDSKFSYIEIEDDGNGMTKIEFEKYLTIAGTKQTNQVTRKYNRKRIGQFGVGFLSIFPFCEGLEITTTAENSTQVLKATIPTGDYFEEKKKSKGVNTKSNALEANLVDDIPVNGIITNNPTEKIEHYTKIRLINPTRIVKQYFTRHKTKKRDSILTWEPLKRFIWELQEDLPIALSEESKYHEQYKYDEPIGITVQINKKTLHRNDYYNQVLSEGTEIILGIKCKYVFTTDYKSILPLEARGVKIRVTNVGIGPRTDFFLKRDRGYSRLHWLTGELFFSEEIKEHLNISRDAFISNSITDEIFDFFAEKLKNLAYEVETVAEAEKQFSNVTNPKKKLNVKSTTDVITSNLKKLESKGYTVVETKNKKISVDKVKKTVYLPARTLKDVEKIEIAGSVYELKYDKWNIKTEFSACKMVGKNQIVLNENYPLFKSKSLGGALKKIHILILLGAQKTKTPKAFASFLNDNILTEFS